MYQHNERAREINLFNWIGSNNTFAFVGRQHAHHFTVFGNGTAGDIDIVRLEHSAILLSLNGFLGFSPSMRRFYFGLHAGRCDGFAVYPLDGAVEEVFELKMPWGVWRIYWLSPD
jgi:hypothetical protein